MVQELVIKEGNRATYNPSDTNPLRYVTYLTDILEPSVISEQTDTHTHTLTYTQTDFGHANANSPTRKRLLPKKVLCVWFERVLQYNWLSGGCRV